MKLTRTSSLLLCILAIGLAMGVVVHAQAPAAAPAAAAAPVPAADAQLAAAAAKAPAVADLAKGDPGGTITGTISDVPAADSTKGVTLPDVASQTGQNKIAINFVWTLVTGFLVMFMQAGFAMVESGLCRVKNANHTYMMNFFVYTCGSVLLLAGRFRHTNGRRGRQRKPGRSPVSDGRAHTLALRQDVGLLRRRLDCFSPATPMTSA